MSASIVIDDDEVSILNSLSSILEDEGYEVSVAKSGIEALKLCESSRTDDAGYLDARHGWVGDAPALA